MSKVALIIVDVQNDFLPQGPDRPGGSLAVPDGDQVIPVIERLLEKGEEGGWEWGLVVATQDYHPPAHISFASRHSVEPFTSLQVTDARGNTYEQTMWPDHCVRGTKGAEIDTELRKALGPWKSKMKIVRKACHCDVEAYSAFEGYVTEPTDPAEPPEHPDAAAGEVAALLHEAGVGKVVVTGLATDFCVKETTLDSLKAGFPTALLVPAARGVFEEGSKAALEAISQRGGVCIGAEGREWEKELRGWMNG